MRLRFGRYAWLVALVIVALVGVAWLSQTTGQARLVHTEPSEFAPVVVYDRDGVRCMSFNGMDDAGRQTCFQLSEPEKMVFEYTRMMASALLVQPVPENILIIGLGGGTLPTALARILPNAVIDSVEIDPAVLRVAQAYFGFQPGPSQRVFVEDGRQFVERAVQDGTTYDMVLLDAFDVDYIPAHLLTVEFFEQIKAVLSERGILVANSFAGSDIYARESATYAAVFGPFFNLRGRQDGNRVIIAARMGLPSDEVLKQNAAALEERLTDFGLDMPNALSRFSRAQDWPQDAKPLRD